MKTTPDERKAAQAAAAAISNLLSRAERLGISTGRLTVTMESDRHRSTMRTRRFLASGIADLEAEIDAAEAALVAGLP